jgi:hypothetical protein
MVHHENHLHIVDFQVSNEDYWIESWEAMKNLENSPQPEC